MKKFLVALFLLFATASFALDRNAFTFTGYDLNLRLEPEQSRLGVRGKIKLRNDSSTPQKNLSLQISSSLAWRSIQLDGHGLDFVSQPYTSDIDHTGALSEAIVSFDKAIPSKGAIELEIGYEGTVPLDATRLIRMGVPKEMAAHTDWDQIGAETAVRGIGYVTWYPVALEAVSLSDGNTVFDAVQAWKIKVQFSTMRVNLCSVGNRPVTETLLMNGPGTNAGSGGSVGSPNELSEWTSCAEYAFEPLGLTVPTFAAGNYSAVNGQTGDTYHLPDHKTEAGIYQSASDRVASFVTEWFGAPKRKVQVVELADPKAAPFESGNLLLTPLNFTADTAESIAVHQLTHAAMPAPRPWIYEGLAHFGQALYAEHTHGREAALEFMNSYRPQIVEREKAIAAEHAPNAASEQSLINTASEEFYRSKAMYVWWMLRDMLNDGAIKAAIAAYKPDRDREPSYIQHLLADQSKRDLEWFFDDWVYRDRGLPDFHIVSVYPRQTMRDTYLVTITIENLGDVAAEVPVMSPYKGIETVERVEIKGKAKASVRLQMAEVPEEATVNDGSVPETDFTNDTTKLVSKP